MKKELLTLSLLFTLTAFMYAQTNTQCDFFIRSDFDSECVLTAYKEKVPLLFHDESECMIACAGSHVMYYAVNLPTGFTTEWTVIGTDNYTVNQQGTQIYVNWPEDLSAGHITLTATGPDNTICIKEACIELIEKPVAGIISNPPHIGYIDDDIQYIEVCDGQEIQFFSNSSSSAEAPIVGYRWTSDHEEWATQNFTFIADFDIYEGEATIEHTVINECGCIDNITYVIKINKIPILEVSCYGTACENDQATYSVDPNICHDFNWLVEGGEIVSGQTTNEITVLWNNIENGYGYLAIDGNNCGQDICPALSYIAFQL